MRFNCRLAIGTSPVFAHIKPRHPSLEKCLHLYSTGSGYDGDMLDFQSVRERKTKLVDLAIGLTKDDLRRLTNEMIDTQLKLIADCTDADVVFQPVDPGAKDDAAATEAEKEIAWTLGHVIVHGTASSEEAAFLAAEMARGVVNHGRSRSEVNWTTVTTIAQCRARLEESRRMRLAAIEMWPDKPNTELHFEPFPTAGQRNCFAQFIGGLSHDDSHVAQVAEVVRQAKTARKLA